MGKESRRRIVSDVEEIPKVSKFKNKRVILTDGGTILKPEHVKQIRGFGLHPDNGITFDSEMEALFYRDVLMPRVAAGEIEVKLQPKFLLLADFEKDGVKYRPIVYIPDFLVTYPDGRSEAVDVKGFHTPVFALKRKIFDANYPDVKLLVMKRVIKYGGWITVEEYAALKKSDRQQDRGHPRTNPSRSQGRKRS